MKLMALCILAATVMLAFVQFDSETMKDTARKDSALVAGKKKPTFVRDSIVKGFNPVTGQVDTLYHRTDTLEVAAL